MFSNVNSFHESASEMLYRDLSRWSDWGPILGCRHPVSRNPKVRTMSVFVFIGRPCQTLDVADRFDVGAWKRCGTQECSHGHKGCIIRHCTQGAAGRCSPLQLLASKPSERKRYGNLCV